MSLQKKPSLYLFLGCRWALLLIGLLMYSKDHSVTPELLLVAVFFQTLYSLAHIQFSHKVTVLVLAAIDVGFSMYLFSRTGGLSSPLLFYGFTGMGMFKAFISWRVYYFVTWLYAMFIPLLFVSLSPLSGDAYMRKHFDYMFIMLSFFLIVGVVHYGKKVVQRECRKFVMIYTSRPYAISAKLQGVIPYLEDVLKKVLDGREVVLCLEAASQFEKVQSWKHTYYMNYMKQDRPSPANRRAEIPSPTGELLSFYIETLTDRLGNSYGWLLVRADERELSMLHKIYIRFLLIRLEADYYVRRELAHAEEKAVAIERDMIAQNIHDGIAQELFFMSIQLFQLKQSLPPDARDQVLPYVVDIEKKVKESHRDIRQFIIELKDEKRTINLHHAIEKLLHRVTEQTGVKPVFEKNGWVAHEQLDIEEAIYHLVEEAANNVIKHAQAKNIHVQIEVTSVQWAISIKDDGIGMTISEGYSQGRYGLGGMENRIRALNGAISIQSEPSKGTTITAYIPRERSTAYV